MCMYDVSSISIVTAKNCTCASHTALYPTKLQTSDYKLLSCLDLIFLVMMRLDSAQVYSKLARKVRTSMGLRVRLRSLLVGSNGTRFSKDLHELICSATMALPGSVFHLNFLASISAMG